MFHASRLLFYALLALRSLRSLCSQFSDYLRGAGDGMSFLLSPARCSTPSFVRLQDADTLGRFTSLSRYPTVLRSPAVRLHLLSYRALSARATQR